MYLCSSHADEATDGCFPTCAAHFSDDGRDEQRAIQQLLPRVLQRKLDLPSTVFLSKVPPSDRQRRGFVRSKPGEDRFRPGQGGEDLEEEGKDKRGRMEGVTSG